MVGLIDEHAVIRIHGAYVVVRIRNALRQAAAAAGLGGRAVRCHPGVREFVACAAADALRRLAAGRAAAVMILRDRSARGLAR